MGENMGMSPPQCTLVAEPEVEAEPRHAPRYKVLLHNDDLTPMPFVVDILQRTFKQSYNDSVKITLEAHGSGIALVEVVPLELAELHVDQARSLARGRGYPLSFSIEPAD